MFCWAEERRQYKLECCVRRRQGTGSAVVWSVLRPGRCHHTGKHLCYLNVIPTTTYYVLNIGPSRVWIRRGWYICTPTTRAICSTKGLELWIKKKYVIINIYPSEIRLSESCCLAKESFFKYLTICTAALKKYRPLNLMMIWISYAQGEHKKFKPWRHGTGFNNTLHVFFLLTKNEFVYRVAPTCPQKTCWVSSWRCWSWRSAATPTGSAMWTGCWRTHTRYVPTYMLPGDYHSYSKVVLSKCKKNYSICFYVRISSRHLYLDVTYIRLPFVREDAIWP